MKLTKVSKGNDETYGLTRKNHFYEVKSSIKSRLPLFQDIIREIYKKISDQKNHFEELELAFNKTGIPLSSVKILPPFSSETKIICIGINYPKKYPGKLIEKPKNMILFSKFQESLVGTGETLLLPAGKSRTSFDYEGEVAIVIGKTGFGLKKEEAEHHILGYTLINDGSVRDWQNHSIEAGKNFYKSGSCGPFILTKDKIKSLKDLSFETRLNGKLVQKGNLSDMFFNMDQIISYISNIIPLNAGDIIATGSPEGTGASRTPKRFLREGDKINVSSKSLGTLTNTVRS